MEHFARVLHWTFYNIRAHERTADGETRHADDVRVPVER